MHKKNTTRGSVWRENVGQIIGVKCS